MGIRDLFCIFECTHVVTGLHTCHNLAAAYAAVVYYDTRFTDTVFTLYSRLYNRLGELMSK